MSIDTLLSSIESSGRIIDPQDSRRARKVRLRVGHDLDGCYYLFDSAWWQGMATLDPAWGENVHYRPARTWEFYEQYGINLGSFIARSHDLADRGLLWSWQPEPNAVDVWHELHNEGHMNVVGTDRAFGTHPIASQVGTYDWLRTHRLPFESVTFTADKTELDVDVMIEDKLANYDALEAAGTLVYLLDRPWNQEPGDTVRRRIYSTQEYVTRVRALAHTLNRELALVDA